MYLIDFLFLNLLIMSSTQSTIEQTNIVGSSEFYSEDARHVVKVHTEEHSSSANAVTEDMISKHMNAINELQRCFDILSKMPDFVDLTVAGQMNEYLNEITHFKVKKLTMGLSLAKDLLDYWNIFYPMMNLRNNPKVQASKKRYSVKWNATLNRFRGCIHDYSSLNGLLLINGHHGFQKFHEPRVRQRKDISTLELREEGDCVLKVSVGRLFCDSIETMRIRICSYLDNVGHPGALTISSTKNLPTKRINWGIFPGENIDVSIQIDFPVVDASGGLTGEKSHVSSNDPSVLAFFFGGTFPGYSEVRLLMNSSKKCCLEEYLRYKDFLSFVEKMRRKICQLIDISQTHPGSVGFNYSFIRCARTTPDPCGCEAVIRKPSSKLVAYTCKECNLQMCAHGCGRTHHDDTPCNIPPDEASAIVIGRISTECPVCHKRYGKLPGTCNHMTCTEDCLNEIGNRTEFCFVCAREYEKDEYGHYTVTDHHSARRPDGSIICPQFA